MEYELIQEYIKRFNNAFSIKNTGDDFSYVFLELNDEKLYSEQQRFVDNMMNYDQNSDDVFSSAALIFYGYRLGAVRLKNRNEIYSRQDGYLENGIWRYDLDSILNENTEEKNLNSAASHIIEWAINPKSNIDIADSVFSKMIVPLINNLCRITLPGKEQECTIILPPFSKDIEIPEWTSIFSRVKTESIKIKITNYGHLLKLNEDEQKYFVIYQTDEEKEYIIIMLYEYISGHNTCVGCMAFDVSDYDHQYILQDIIPVSFLVDNRKKDYVDKDNNIEKTDYKSKIEFIKCKYRINEGLISFLGNNTASFGRELYKFSGEDIDQDSFANTVKNIFKDDEALTTNEICSRLVKQDNLHNIALGDLANISNYLQRSRKFVKVSITTKKEFKLGTIIKFGSSIDIKELAKIPSNYAFVTWRLKDRRKKICPYFELDKKINSEMQIIESVIDHFDHCSTTTVAEELLFYYKNGEDPSAYFVAKVFMYLLQLDSIEIDSKFEMV